MNPKDELDFLLESALALHQPTKAQQKQCKRRITQKIGVNMAMQICERTKRIQRNAFRVCEKNPIFAQGIPFLTAYSRSC